MKVLLVSTQSAYRTVLEIVKELAQDYVIDVYPSRAVVAQFTTCEELAEELRARLGRCSYDYVIIPGLVRGSAKVIEEAIGCRVYKGSKYAGDIPQVLKLLSEGVELSKEVPADELCASVFTSSLQQLYHSQVSSKKPYFEVGGVGVYLDPPPLRLLLEVLISTKGFEEKISRAIESGFDGVVIGCESKCDVALLSKYLDRARELFSEGIIGVDVARPAELPRDIVESVDLLFNVAHTDVDRLSRSMSSSSGVVVIPSTVENLEESLRSVKRAISLLNEVGITKVVVDPLLRPPGAGFTESLIRFYTSRTQISYPHLFGTANVYEMIDADSHGVIALLMSMAMELSASMVLATEESTKACGAIEEHAIARHMAYVSYLKKSPPKDIPGGLDLLVVKSKGLKAQHLPAFEGPTKTVSTVELQQDPKYYVKIYVDLTRREIVVDVMRAGSEELLARFVGSSPTSLARAIVKEFDLSTEHAAYLGYELGKAELALKLWREYEQDSEVLLTPREKLSSSKSSLLLSRKKA